MKPTTTILWLEGGGCDGCTMSVLGAANPSLEDLLAPGAAGARVQLVHPILALESGHEYRRHLEAAAAGHVTPLVLVVEGTLFERREPGSGSWSQLGTHDGEPITVRSWVERIAPHADAVIAIGSCATWGGVPAAAGNVTGATSLHGILGERFRTRADLPIVNLPGCAPSGEAFLEAVSYTLLHLEGTVPLDLDEQHRPRWLYAATTELAPARGSQAAAREPRDTATADCPVPARGWINRLGGCATVGGACTGCTRPDFPDRTLPLVVG